jgi:hypothetical protein
VITNVELRNPQGIKVVGIKVFVFSDEGGGTLVGSQDHFPPAAGPISGTSLRIPWSAGLDVPGATLPSDPHTVANVVLGLVRDTGGTGKSDGLDVHYTSGGTDYTYHGQFAIVLAPGPCS